MCVSQSGERFGAITSGCIDADIARQAVALSGTTTTKILRYGEGSPYFDMKLPCGGSIDVLLVPCTSRKVVDNIRRQLKDRCLCHVRVHQTTGQLEIINARQNSEQTDFFEFTLRPSLRFLVFGTGEETAVFSAMVSAAGYDITVFSPREDIINSWSQHNVHTCGLVQPAFPSGLNVDEFTAIVLFFHEHDWEPEIIYSALKTPAFYIGAQGSLRARNARFQALKTLGAKPADLDRLYGPIGVIPSARDAHTLAVSVLAEILQTAMELTS